MRRRRKPDTRLDWRDPNMPVIRDIEYQNGMRVWRVQELIAPEIEQKYRIEVMQHYPRQDWRQDPTYHMAKRRRCR